MPHTVRRLALVGATALAAAMAACTNPVAPAAPSGADAPAERPSSGVYMGGVG